jgi:hypothetical protein
MLLGICAAAPKSATFRLCNEKNETDIVNVETITNIAHFYLSCYLPSGVVAAPAIEKIAARHNIQNYHEQF